MLLFRTAAFFVDRFFEQISIDKFTMHNAQFTIMERAMRAYLNRDEITGFCLRIDTDLV